MSRIKAAILMAALAGMSDLNSIHYRDRPEREPKNKFNLTPEQIDAISEMTPKEKKKYLRSLTPPERTEK